MLSNSGGNCHERQLATGVSGESCRNRRLRGSKLKDGGAIWKFGEFYKILSPRARIEFESLAVRFRCEGGTALVSEGDRPDRVLFLLDGRVRLSINSAAGKRLVLGIAEAGDILGVAAVVSGAPSEITAEAQCRCSIASLPRQNFLDFLRRYPIASYAIGRQLGVEFKRACKELRTVSLSGTASMKLARLLVEWCAGGIETERGVRIEGSLTNEEIGEYIGVGRETVSRTMTDFKNRELLQKHGSTMFVTSMRALELYAGQVSR